jgi:glycerol-3-phosphate acyltransferase PlsY
VSGTGLYAVAGFRPLAVAGSLDVAKGMLGPILAGRDRPVLGALATGLAITGHNWSPALAGAGGRGISPALGSMLVSAPEGALILGAGLGAGRLVHQSGLGTALALLALIPVLGYRRGRTGVVLAASVALPMLIKRVLGNQPPRGPHLGRTIVTRVLFDQDPDPRHLHR